MKRMLLRSGNITLPLFLTETGQLGLGKSRPLQSDTNHYFPHILTTFGSIDYRDPGILIANEDGYCSRRFEVIKIQQSELKPSLLPKPREPSETTEIIYEDLLKEVRVHQLISCYAESVFSVHLEIENISNKPLFIKKSSSLECPLEGSGYHILSFPGAWAKERIPEETALKTGAFVIQSRKGVTSHFQNPLLILHKGRHFYGFNLIYSGNHKESVEVDHLGNTKVLVGMNDFLLDWKLEGHESFEAPTAIFTMGKSYEEIQNHFNNFIKHHILPKPDRQFVVYNTWEGSQFDLDSEKWIPLAKKASSIGAEVFLFDDGWFQNRNFEEDRGHGDWNLDENKLGASFEKIKETLHRLDLKFGLWIEPEMVSPGSLLAKEHPEFILRRKGMEPLTIRGTLMLDLANPKVVDYLKKRFSRWIEESGVEYVKWDFNRWMSDVESEACRGGEYMHRYILGYYDFISYLTKTYPHITFEGCSAGGARFDLGTLSYVRSIWASDNTDPLDRLLIQEGTSLGYPISSISAHYSASPNDWTKREFSYKTRFEVAMMASFGVETNLNKLDSNELAYLKENIAYYKRHRKLILQGDYHLLSDPLNHQKKGWLVQKDKEAMLLLANAGKRECRTFLLPQFNEEHHYRVSIHDGESYLCGGDELRRGLPFPAPSVDGLSTALYHIEDLG